MKMNGTKDIVWNWFIGLLYLDIVVIVVVVVVVVVVAVALVGNNEMWNIASNI
jgi:hypothetical protein